MGELLSPEKSELRLGDLIELRSGERLVVDGVSDWYGDKDGRHDGPWVRTKTWERHLLSEVVRVVKRNPRECRFCGEGVTSTNPDLDYCRTCHYGGRAQNDQHSDILDQFHAGLPDARYIGIEHTGGGCFWFAVYGPEESPYYWAMTNGDGGIPNFADGEGWAMVYRYCDEDVSREVVIDGVTYHESEGIPVLEGLPDETAWSRPTLTHEEVIKAIAADMAEVSTREFPMRAYSAIVVAKDGVRLIEDEVPLASVPILVTPDVVVWHGDHEGVSCGVRASHREAAYRALHSAFPGGVIDDLDLSADEAGVLAVLRKEKP